MDARLSEFILQNQVCSEMIFRDWDTFLEILFDCGGAVGSILWFECVAVDDQKLSMGSGGYSDAMNPGYMWAETMMYDRDLASMTLLEIRQHINAKIETCYPHDMVPCFFEIIE